MSSSLLRIALGRRALPTSFPSASLARASQRRAASGVHYNEPTGYLFGEKVRPLEKEPA